MCKYQFGNNLTPYQTAAAAARFVDQQGFGKKWHMLANNYSWPQMFERAYSIVAKQVGAEWTGVTWAPLGTRDFLPFLPKVAAAKADVVFIATWAADQVACAKQMQEFGLRQADAGHPRDHRARPSRRRPARACTRTSTAACRGTGT